jgi:hypothetical protein
MLMGQSLDRDDRVQRPFRRDETVLHPRSDVDRGRVRQRLDHTARQVHPQERTRSHDTDHGSNVPQADLGRLSFKGRALVSDPLSLQGKLIWRTNGLVD